MNRIVNAIVGRLASHSFDRVEEMLLGLRDFERLTTPRESCRTIICDDGEVTHLDVVEVLNKRRVKGVFAVSPDLIGRPGFLTYEQLRAIRGEGHELAFHGTTHDPFTGFGDKNNLLNITLDGYARERQLPVRTVEAHLAHSIPRNTGLRGAGLPRDN